MLPTDAGPAAESLGTAGFEHLADLLYLVSSAQAFPTAAPVEPLQYEPYSPQAAQRFAAVIERTYRDTLDCPQLDGLRTIDEVLEGYRAVGRFSPDHWMLVRRDVRDVGCLLLANHPEQRIWELVYMGASCRRARVSRPGVSRRAAGPMPLAVASRASERLVLAAVDVRLLCSRCGMVFGRRFRRLGSPQRVYESVAAGGRVNLRKLVAEFAKNCECYLKARRSSREHSSAARCSTRDGAIV